jgi:hypothetical protein
MLSLLGRRRHAPVQLQQAARIALRRSSRFLASRRAASTVTDLQCFPSVGEKLHGFTIRQKKHVPELHLTAVHLNHDKTGADYLHVAREDKNNVFGIGFKTNPPDATGVPHILEHTTLCGSKKSDFYNFYPGSTANKCF